MDSAEFLDLLGNENRRRILQLLARKPCYVTEISEFLGVSPKAVIDHLRKLEEAGLVNSRTDDRRRKYFSINRHIRLEVTVSPYEFGTKSAYPASTRLDLTSCHRLSIDIDEKRQATNGTGERPSGEAAESSRRDGDGDAASGESRRPAGGTEPTGELREPAEQSGDQTESNIQGSSTDIIDLTERLHDLKQLEQELSLAQRWTQGQITELRDALGSAIGNGDPRLISELLLSLADGGKGAHQLGQELDAPVPVVEEVLDELATEGVVDRSGHEWELDA